MKLYLSPCAAASTLEKGTMKKNILLIEYEPRYVERVGRAVNAAGYQMEVAEDLEVAVERCAHFEPDLVILTSVLPRLKLEDAITQLRARAGLRSTPFLILMSGYRGSEPTADAARYGAQDILERPFSGEVLVQRVEALTSTSTDPATTQAIPQDMLNALRRSAGMGDEGAALTSDELFGDILSDVERPAPASQSAEPAPEPTTKKPKPASEDRARETTSPIDATLEDMLTENKPVSKRRTPRESTDVDTILSRTLAGLDVQPLRRRSTTPPEPDVNVTSAPAETTPKKAEVPAEPEPTPLEPTPEPPDEPKPVDAFPAEEAEVAAAPVTAEPPVEEPAEPEPEPPAATSAPTPEVPSARVAPPPAHSEDSIAAPGTADAEAVSEGTQFGQYVLMEHIATGGMAEVYKARMMGMEGFQKTVAIKRILPHLTDNDEFVTMFIDEAKLAAQLNHNNIIHIYDLGKIDRSYYIAMEYIEGRDLRSILQRCRERSVQLPVPLAMYIANRLCAALDYAHRKRDFDNRDLGLVHRDVSPQNVLISYEGDIKLCDFGIAKAASKASHTRAGALKGKLQYMSPEQAWGKDIDHRSDLFSLGLVIFEMLTGEKQFKGDSELSILEQVRNPTVTAPSAHNPEVPELVDQLAVRALESGRDDRFQSARDLQREIEKALRNNGWNPSPADVARFLTELYGDAEITQFAAPSATVSTPAEAKVAPAPTTPVTPLDTPSAAPEKPDHSPQPASPAPSTPPKPAAAPAPDPAPKPEPVVAPVVEPVAEAVVEEPPKRGRAGLWLALAAVAIIAGVLGVVFLGGGGEPPATETAGSQTGSEPAAVGISDGPTETPTPTMEERALQLAQERIARADEELEEMRERVAQDFPTPTPPPTSTPAPTHTATSVPPTPTATAKITSTPRPRATATATVIPPTATPSVREGDIVTPGPGVVSPTRLHVVTPRYPPVALRTKASGEVELQALVGIDGTVEEIKIIDCTRQGVGFEDAASDAVRQWRYRPATKNGVKVRMWITIRVPFRV